MRPHARAAAVIALLSTIPALSTAWAQTAASATPSEATLPTVTVTSQPEPAYPARSSAALRSDIPLEQTPQSVIAIGRPLIEAQSATSVTEVLRNVSNIRVVDSRDAFNTQPRIRGFAAATQIDGVAVPFLFANLETTAVIEQLDVLKGPAPALNTGAQVAGGFGFVGGAVAITTQSPLPVVQREIGLRVGSWGERGIHADLNQPVSDILAVRLIANHEREKSESDRIFARRTSFFPSLSLKPSAGSELLIKGRISRVSNLDYSGLPLEGTVRPASFSIPRSRSVTADGQPESTSDTDGLTIQWKQAINADWSWQLLASHQRAELAQYGAYTNDFFSGGSVAGPSYTLQGIALLQEVKSTTFNPSIQGRIRTGSLRHTLTAGLDFDRTSDDAAIGRSSMGNYNIVTDTRLGWVAPIVNTASGQSNDYRSQALFVQDHITSGPWSALVSLKHSRVKINNVWPAFAGLNSETTNSKTTPRIGATYAFTPQISAFAGWGESFSVPTNALFSTPPKPESARQAEIGMRFKDLAGLSGSIAVFDLRRLNAPVADPARPFNTLQTGEQRSRGVDVDLQWQAARSTRIDAHFSHQNPTITRDTTAALVGTQLFNVPKRTARLAVAHDFGAQLKGLSAGLGVSYRSRLPGDSSNTFFTPAATVWDAQLNYRSGAMRYALAINNLLDKKFYEPSAYFAGGHVTPAPRRSLRLSANYLF